MVWAYLLEKAIKQFERAGIVANVRVCFCLLDQVDDTSASTGIFYFLVW
jgi:hypothetical protein